MTQGVTVSVCIATFNQAAYIEDCVLSVLAQSVDADVEVLVGDDGSTDSTAKILKMLSARYPGRLTPIIRSSNIGGTQNYQDLVLRARGEYIAHLDGDDAWLPGKLRAQLAFMAEHMDCPAVYTNAIAVASTGRLRGPFTNAHPVRLPLGYVVARGNFLMHSSILYRARHRELFLDMSPPVIDWAIHLAFAKLGRLGFIDNPLAIYRVGTATSTVRNAYPFVQALLWDALRTAAADLPRHQRLEAAAHFAAEALIAQLRGKTATRGPILGEIAHAIGVSRSDLLVRAVPAIARVAWGAGRRVIARQLGVLDWLAEHRRL